MSGAGSTWSTCKPTNVPTATFNLQATYRVPAVTGLSLHGGLARESSHFVLPYNIARIAGCRRVDAGARLDVSVMRREWAVRAGADKLFDHQAWKEKRVTLQPC